MKCSPMPLHTISQWTDGRYSFHGMFAGQARAHTVSHCLDISKTAGTCPTSARTGGLTVSGACSKKHIPSTSRLPIGTWRMQETSRQCFWAPKASNRTCVRGGLNWPVTQTLRMLSIIQLVQIRVHRTLASKHRVPSALHVHE